MRWLFDTDSFMPRAHCGRWDEPTIFLGVASNILIGLAYYAIPVMLYLIYHQRKKDFPKSWIMVCFVIFIFACGTTHFLDALMFFWPAYRFLILIDIFTAIISIYTACVLPKVAQYLIKMPSLEDLRFANLKLEEMGKEKDEMLFNLRETNHDLANKLQRLQNTVLTQGWINEKQLDLEGMRKVVAELRKQYATGSTTNAGPNQTSP